MIESDRPLVHVEPVPGSPPIPSDEVSNAFALSMLMGKNIVFRYRNWRGEEAERIASISKFSLGVTEWHPIPGWLVHGVDLRKNEDRIFSLGGFIAGSIREATADEANAAMLKALNHDK